MSRAGLQRLAVPSLAVLVLTIGGSIALATAPHLPWASLRAVLGITGMALVPGVALASMAVPRADGVVLAGFSAIAALAWHAALGVVLPGADEISNGAVIGLSAVAGLVAANAGALWPSRSFEEPTVGPGASGGPSFQAVATAVVVSALAVGAVAAVAQRAVPLEAEPRPSIALALPDARSLDRSAGAGPDRVPGVVRVTAPELRLPVQVTRSGGARGTVSLEVLVDGAPVQSLEGAGTSPNAAQTVIASVPVPDDGCTHRVSVRPAGSASALDRGQVGLLVVRLGTRTCPSEHTS
jgi:hypothetical protein